MSQRFTLYWTIVCACILCMDTVCAQTYPSRPIHIITNEAGGGNDFAARLLGTGISANLGQQIVVDNRGGSGGVAAIEPVAQAQPDGYTLLLHGSSIWLLQYMRDDVPWDPIRDFAAVTLPVRSPMVLVVNPAVPATSVQEFVTLAKAKAGLLNEGAGGVGSSTHIAGELFKSMTGVKTVRVNYKGAGPAVNALIAGEVQLTFSTIAAVAVHVKSGRLRALAVTTAQPTALLPGVPTMAASGLPGYDTSTLYGLFAPAKTPPAIINRLNREIVVFLSKPDIKDKFFAAGMDVVASSPEQLEATMKSEMVKLGKVIKSAGIRAE